MPYFELEQLPPTFKAVFFRGRLAEDVEGVIHDAPLYVGRDQVFETAFVISRMNTGDLEGAWDTTQVNPVLAGSLYLNLQNLLFLYSVIEDKFHEIDVSGWVSREDAQTAVIGWNHLSSVVRTCYLTPDHHNLVLEMQEDSCTSLP